MSIRAVLAGTLLLSGLCLPNAVLAQQGTPAANKQQAANEAPLTYSDYMSLGYNAHEEGRYYEATQYFRYALYLNPEDRAAVIAYWNARDAIDQDPSAVQYDQLMNTGYDATQAGNYGTALNNFEEALALRPNDPYASQAIRNVTTYINRGEGTGETAVDEPVLNDFSTTAPEEGVSTVGESAYDRYMRLGYAAQQREDFVDAANYFRSALYERPNDRWATIAYWNAINGTIDGDAGLGSETGAETAYDRYMRLGYDATQRDDYEAALSFFQQALELRPDDYYASEAIDNVTTYMNQ